MKQKFYYPLRRKKRTKGHVGEIKDNFSLLP
jgi:hypothetical protein